MNRTYISDVSNVHEMKNESKSVLFHSLEDIHAVICCNAQQAKSVFSLLEPNFSESIRLQSSDLNLNNGIIVTTVNQVKGLEFYNVLVWDISEENYPDSQVSARQLYVAATRAEENLCLVTYGKISPFLSKLPADLARKFPIK